MITRYTFSLDQIDAIRAMIFGNVLLHSRDHHEAFISDTFWDALSIKENLTPGNLGESIQKHGKWELHWGFRKNGTHIRFPYGRDGDSSGHWLNLRERYSDQWREYLVSIIPDQSLYALSIQVN